MAPTRTLKNLATRRGAHNTPDAHPVQLPRTTSAEGLANFGSILCDEQAVDLKHIVSLDTNRLADGTIQMQGFNAQSDAQWA